MQLILARLAQESDELRREAAGLALAAARKIAGEAMAAYPVDTMEQVALEAVKDLRSEPRLSVRCNPALVEQLAERLEKTARDAGFDGAIMVRGDDGMPAADIRLEWGAGAIQRSADEIDKRLNDVVARWLAAVPLEDDNSDTDTGPAAGVSAA